MTLQSTYAFGEGIKHEGLGDEILGGKGAKLAEMGGLGLPVPPGVTITTEQCNEFFALPTEDLRANFIAGLVDEVIAGYSEIKFNLGYMPLVSVRSGARVSMPGMMDTVLNVGINSANLPEWQHRLGGECADDCYRRLIEMYSDVVLGIPKEVFENDADSTADMLATFKTLTDTQFPQTLADQLTGCIEAVFNSWFSDRACAYRAMHGYPDDWGTAVNVQTMVFGNRNNESCSGVFFTRNFNTGDTESIIDWLPNAQGEDVVNGSVTPNTTADFLNWNSDIANELIGIGDKMEEHYKDMQDMEFTVEDGKLYILQTRTGKRASLAAFTIAFDLVTEGVIDKTEALARVTGKDYLNLTAPKIDPEFNTDPDVTGVPASGNIVTGVAVLSAADATGCKEPCILIADETTPEDFSGMAASVGIVTRNGGITSHAAVVARGMNKTCIVGAENLKFEGLAGKQVTIDGSTGRIWIDKDVPVITGTIPEFVSEMLEWSDSGADIGILSVTPESVSEGGTFHVDVSGSLDNQKSLSAALDSLKGANGIISFGNNAPASESDATFLGFFGIDSMTTPVDTFTLIDKVLGMAKWNAAFKKAWTLHLPSDATVVYCENLRDKGWNVVQKIDCFKAALAANGYVVLGKNFLEQLDRENMTFGEIEKLMKEAGRDLQPLPEPVSKTRILFDQLGG